MNSSDAEKRSSGHETQLKPFVWRVPDTSAERQNANSDPFRHSRSLRSNLEVFLASRMPRLASLIGLTLALMVAGDATFGATSPKPSPNTLSPNETAFFDAVDLHFTHEDKMSNDLDYILGIGANDKQYAINAFSEFQALTINLRDTVLGIEAHPCFVDAYWTFYAYLESNIVAIAVSLLHIHTYVGETVTDVVAQRSIDHIKVYRKATLTTVEQARINCA